MSITGRFCPSTEVIGGADQPIKDASDGNDWVKGCTCVTADEHTALGILDANHDDIVTISDAQADDLVEIRNAAREVARKNCEDIADSEFGGAVWDDTCAAEVDDETKVFLDPHDYACDAAERIGFPDGFTNPPSDGYADYYSLGTVIVYNSGQGRYYIDDVFFYDMLDNAAWLLDDAARIVYDPNSSPPYKFSIPGTAGVAYHLGIRNNDRPVSINGYTLSGGMLDALVAYTAVKTSTSFTLVVKRSGVNTTLRYTVQ